MVLRLVRGMDSRFHPYSLIADSGPMRKWVGCKSTDLSGRGIHAPTPWKRKAAYHRQARVENAFFRYKSIIGDRLRARSRGGRVAETVVACNVLDQMTELGRPESYSIGR